jgi:putative DNA primase/helicase
VYQSYFEYDPVAKFWIATNHLPIISESSEAIWRRIRRVRFDVHIPKSERDPRLKQRLRKSTELSGILNWALEGLRQWQRERLGESRQVERATAEYRTEQDLFGAFLAERCVVDKKHRVSSNDLYTAYKMWSSTNSYKAMTNVAFGRKMKEKGFRQKRLGPDKARTWLGVEVRWDVPDG